MLLSISGFKPGSNSKSVFKRSVPDGSWKRILITGIIIFLLVFGGLELFWRVNGHLPSVVDDYDLWSYYRHRVYDNGVKTVVLLGASRIQLDISTGMLKKIFPDYLIIQLAVDGRQPIAVLKDLANDKCFKGIVICSMFAGWVGKENLYSQQDYVKYYHENSNPFKRLNRLIMSYVQEYFVIVDPYLQLKRILLKYKESGKLPGPRYLITKRDRSRMADYSLINVSEQQKYRIKRIGELYKKNPPMAPKEWLKHAAKIGRYVKRITERGGKVVFIRLPSTGKHWELDNKFYPKKEYWDKIASVTGACTIHFQDISGMKQLVCPDTSHLDYRQAPLFTRVMAEEFLKQHIIEVLTKSAPRFPAAKPRGIGAPRIGAPSRKATS
ncbi:MAG TPA: hypothetical protein ENG35_05480 [Desulfobacteraceae bacterium]|nr:hypothetical protein [Desulfobacteraceae bacterium]